MRLTGEEAAVNVFEHLAHLGYGEVHFARDARTGLRAIIAIHDTRLGPSLGGCRFIPYAHEELALIDSLRLARGMTYKAAISGIPASPTAAEMHEAGGIPKRGAPIKQVHSLKHAHSPGSRWISLSCKLASQILGEQPR